MSARSGELRPGSGSPRGRILLVNPPSAGIYQRLGFVFPPLGLAYVAAALQRRGHRVEIWDNEIAPEPPAPLEQYALVGISSDTSKAPRAYALARRAREAGAVVVMGGPHPTFLPDEALAQGADFVVLGEGEEIFPELVERLLAGGAGRSAGAAEIGDLPGVHHRGRSSPPPVPPPPRDLDRLPFPARELLEMHRYRRLELRARKITPLVSSRGCPFVCDFCSSAAFSTPSWRPRSPESVLEELELLVRRFSFGAVAFTDDAFMISPSRVAAIAEGILRRGLDVLWWSFARVDTVLAHPELLPLMHRSGARTVFLGIESGSQEELDELGKGTQVHQAREAVELLRRHGIDTIASFILGAPGETRESLERTIRLARRLRPAAAQFSLLTPYPGTDLYRRLHDRIWQHDWSAFDCLHPTFHLDHLTPRQLRRGLARAYRRFYLTPRRILDGLLSARRGKGVKVHRIWKDLRRLGDG
jgi:anaerobic magnesium-protoporphyrin IX monomethyl ester cyclase